MILDFLRKSHKLLPIYYATAFRVALANDPGDRVRIAHSEVLKREEARLGVDRQGIQAQFAQNSEIQALRARKEELEGQYPMLVAGGGPVRGGVVNEFMGIRDSLGTAKHELEFSPENDAKRKEAYRIASAEVTLPEPDIECAAQIYTLFVLSRLVEALDDHTERNNLNVWDFEKFLKIQVEIFNYSEAPVYDGAGLQARERAETVLRWMNNTGKIQSIYDACRLKKLNDFIGKIDVEALFELHGQEAASRVFDTELNGGPNPA